jgi:hypothetical protein
MGRARDDMIETGRLMSRARGEIGRLLAEARAHMIETGRLLAEKRAATGHGGYLRWLKTVGLSPTIALRFIHLFHSARHGRLKEETTVKPTPLIDTEVMNRVLDRMGLDRETVIQSQAAIAAAFLLTNKDKASRRAERLAFLEGIDSALKAFDEEQGLVN